MEKSEIIKIEEEVKKSLGLDDFLGYKLKVNTLPSERAAFNQKIGNKYIITISVDKDQKPNLSGFKHELIHLALKNFSYNNLKKNLPVSQQYKDDDKITRFMEYLVVALEIKIGNSKEVEKNIANYEKYGFSKMRDFYNFINDSKLSQLVIEDIINKANSL